MLCHDPRISDDRDHKVETENPALMAVDCARQFHPALTIDWGIVAEYADWADSPLSEQEAYDLLRQGARPVAS